MSTVTRLRHPRERTAQPVRLAVLGWSPEASDALAALEATGHYRGTGIADPSGLALVHARDATALPCDQQALTYLQRGAYDAVLVGNPDLAEMARAGAARSADLLVLAGGCDPHTLALLADVAEEHAVDLAVLDPALHDPGFPELVRLAASSEEWTPSDLDIVVEAPADPDRMLAVAVAQLVRLTPHRAAIVRAEAQGERRSILATVEASGYIARLHVRHAPATYHRIAGDALGGAFEWRTTEDGAFFARYHLDGSRTAHRPLTVDHWRAEAMRVAGRDEDGRAGDLLLVRRELALLDAITRAIESGEAQQTECCRPVEIIEHCRKDGRPPAKGRRAHLRLIVS